MGAFKRHALWVLCLVLALSGTITLFACSGGSLLGSSGDLHYSDPVDSDKRANPGQPRDNTPEVLTPEQPGDLVVGDSNSVLIDYSNADLGYISAESSLTDVKVKIVVYAPGGGDYYQYTLPANGTFVCIPLTMGSGIYQVDAYEHLYDDQYSGLFSKDIAVELINDLTPFLYPNQYVSFQAGDPVVALSQEVTANATSDVEAADQIYMYVVEHISYDYDKAATIQPGYLPNNTDTLQTEEGICFDFASLTAAMMRAQRLPTKLDIGYCGDAYHAWIEVYTKDQGWIRREIKFPGNAFVRLDPTFDSAGNGTGDISRIIGDGTNYYPLFYY